MKTILIIISIAIVLLAANESKAQQPEKTILVQAQGKTIKLNTGDISYLKSVCHNSTIINAINTLAVIKNTDVADNIIIIISNKK